MTEPTDPEKPLAQRAEERGPRSVSRAPTERTRDPQFVEWCDADR